MLRKTRICALVYLVLAGMSLLCYFLAGDKSMAITGMMFSCTAVILSALGGDGE